ncbi:Kruppel-like factor 18 [Mesocricetus auratus]|uniref:Kruppel-like factor 18 n=1 Tax=Mesocricetus auratus TaxID=10036 RepID=A0A3Q0CXC0_MESAU|nr:Kruppel-like factor 18 [Mesocricetus auratus]
MAENEFTKMSSFPQTTEELSNFLQGFFDVSEGQDITSSDFHQEPCFPQPVKDMLVYRDMMLSPEEYQPFKGYQVTNHEDQINHYGQMSLFSSSSQENILGGEYTPSGYQTSAYIGNQDLCMDTPKTSPAGSQPIYDCEMEPTGLDLTHLWSRNTTFNTEANLSHYQEATASIEDPSYLCQMKTASVDENFFSSQKPLPNSEGSHSSQMTSSANQTPYVGLSMHPSSSSVSQSQALDHFSVSTSVQGQLPQEKSDLEPDSHVTQEKPPTLKFFFCPYKDCEKSYKKSYHLKDHIKKHCGEKSFVCNEPGCQWRFFCSEDLRRHQRKHSGECLFPCYKCSKNFSRLNYLKQHQKICTQALPSPGN